MAELYSEVFLGWDTALLIVAGFLIGYVCAKFNRDSTESTSRVINWIAALAAAALCFLFGPYEKVSDFIARIAFFPVAWVAIGITLTVGAVMGEEKAKAKKKE